MGRCLLTDLVEREKGERRKVFKKDGRRERTCRQESRPGDSIVETAWKAG